MKISICYLFIILNATIAFCQQDEKYLALINNSYETKVSIEYLKANRKIQVYPSNDKVKIIGFEFYTLIKDFAEKASAKSDSFSNEMIEIINHTEGRLIFLYNIRAKIGNDTLILNNILLKIGYTPQKEKIQTTYYKSSIRGLTFGSISSDFFQGLTNIDLIPNDSLMTIKNFTYHVSRGSVTDFYKFGNTFSEEDIQRFTKQTKYCFLWFTNIIAVDKSGQEYKLPPVIFLYE